MKKIHQHLAGKTKEEVLEIVKKDMKKDFNSDEWFFYLGKTYRCQRKYQYLLFEDNLVLRSSIIFEYLWEKRVF